MPELVTFSNVKRILSTALYQPQYMFEKFAQVLAGLEQHNGSSYLEWMANRNPSPVPFCELTPVPPTTPLKDGDVNTEDAFAAIMCADAEPLIESVEEFEKYATRLEEISSAAGAVQVLFRVACAGRKLRPKWRFTGETTGSPRVHGIWSLSIIDILMFAGPFVANTSFPILFIANMADNVTPLVSARNNSEGFQDSVILVQNSYGVSNVNCRLQ